MISQVIQKEADLLTPRTCGSWSNAIPGSASCQFLSHSAFSAANTFPLHLKIVRVESDVSRSRKPKWCAPFQRVVSEPTPLN